MTVSLERRLTFTVSTHDWYDTYGYGWWEEGISVETKRTLFNGAILEVQLWFQLSEYRVHPRHGPSIADGLVPIGGRPDRYRYVAKVEKSHEWKNIDSWRKGLGISGHQELLAQCGVPIVIDIPQKEGTPRPSAPPVGSVIEGEVNLAANLCGWDGYLFSPVKGRLVDVTPADLHNGRSTAQFMTLDIEKDVTPAHSIHWSDPDKRVFDTGETVRTSCPRCGGSKVTRAWMGETRRKKGVYCHECLRWSRTIR